MPIMDGYEATRQIRHRGFSFPVVALTADAQEKALQLCVDVGMNGYLVKPLDFEEVARTLDRHLSRGVTAT
jgi:two-component system, sensor histidine kinase SagS